MAYAHPFHTMPYGGFYGYQYMPPSYGSDHFQSHQPGYSMPPAAGAANVVDGPRAQRIEGRKEGDRSDVHVPRGPVPPMAFAGQPVGQYAFDIANGMRNLQVSHPDKIGVPNTQNRSNMAAKGGPERLAYQAGGGALMQSPMTQWGSPYPFHPHHAPMRGGMRHDSRHQNRGRRHHRINHHRGRGRHHFVGPRTHIRHPRGYTRGRAQPRQVPISRANRTRTEMPVNYPSNVNPSEQDFAVPKQMKCFVIKSYSEDDVHKSVKYAVWASTETGNRKLDKAYKEMAGKGPVYLFFSVNGSRQFCGMAQMTSAVDYNAKFSAWAQDKWAGQFTVKWIFLKDIPNKKLRNIIVPNNENKPVTNSRDTQEILIEQSTVLLKEFIHFQSRTSLQDDFAFYDNKQSDIETNPNSTKTLRTTVFGRRRLVSKPPAAATPTNPEGEAPPPPADEKASTAETPSSIEEQTTKTTLMKAPTSTADASTETPASMSEVPASE